jgi:hypothetical protein
MLVAGLWGKKNTNRILIEKYLLVNYAKLTTVVLEDVLDNRISGV